MIWRLLASREPRLAAAAPFYGPLPTGASFKGNKAAVLGVYGGLDARVNAHARRRPRRRSTTARLEHEILTFTEADHAFFNDTGARFNVQAAEEAWRRVVGWFDDQRATATARSLSGWRSSYGWADRRAASGPAADGRGALQYHRVERPCAMSSRLRPVRSMRPARPPTSFAAAGVSTGPASRNSRQVKGGKSGRSVPWLPRACGGSGSLAASAVARDAVKVRATENEVVGCGGDRSLEARGCGTSASSETTSVPHPHRCANSTKRS